MGEAKTKSKRLLQFIKQHPYCCFCGGTSPTETIDHVPSKQIFRLKRRPQGLESPACRNCNEATAPHELVASLIARIYPDPKNELEEKELIKLYKAVQKNRYGLLQEMFPSWKQQYDYQTLVHPDKPKGGGPLNAQGPLLNESMQIFGVKLCQALHYYHYGQIVPLEGGIAIRWFSNWEAMTGAMPDEFSKLFNQPFSLEQGKWNVKDQFEYSYVILRSEEAGAYLSTFGRSFALVGFIFHDYMNFPETSSMKIRRPGTLKETNS